MKKIFSFALLAAVLASCSNEDNPNNETQGRQTKSRDITLNDRFSRVRIDTEQDLTDISFTDANNGIVCGGFGTMMRTTDGGATWTSMAGPTNISYSSAFMYNAQNIFAGRVNFYKANGRGQMEEMTRMSGGPIQSMHFTSATDGFITKSGYVMATNDGGASWTQLHNNYYLSELQFVSDDVAYAYGGTTFDRISRGFISKTTDGGRTWTALDLEIRDINSAYFIDEVTGYMVDFNNVVYKTVDGAATWTEMGVIGSLYGKATSFLYINDQQLLASTNSGEIFKSTDAGATWTVIHQENVPLAKIYRTGNTIYAVGNNGMVLKN